MTAATDLHIGRHARFGQLGTPDGTFPKTLKSKSPKKVFGKWTQSLKGDLTNFLSISFKPTNRILTATLARQQRFKASYCCEGATLDLCIIYRQQEAVWKAMEP